MSAEIEVVVVGAGVIGLAVAAELAEAGRSLVVLERQAGPGRETSSRNSEVIHAGLYYPAGSLKAQLCVEGRHLLYSLCARAGIAHRRIGKPVVASAEAELPALEALHARAAANGVEGLELLDGAAVKRLEPALRAVAALRSPETGILDSHGLIKTLEARAHAAGAHTLYRCELLGVAPREQGAGFRLSVGNPAGQEQLECRILVNAAGLEADRIAALAGRAGYLQHWCKGDYFSVSGPSGRALSRLVYPVPRPDFLGIHVTLDLGGRMRVGPDATYVDRSAGQQAHLAVSEAGAKIFSAAVQRYFPKLREEDLRPDLAGIRPKLQGPGDAFRDFVIRREDDAGLPHLINLVGMESPGLTSSLAIGKLVNKVVLDFLS
jgi:L-2-hydroxyglutarate oxidase LhgO